MNNLKQQIIESLETRNVYDTTLSKVECITLNHQTDPEGFKLYYYNDEQKPSHGVYWKQVLDPYAYREITLNDDEFKHVCEWLNK